MANALVRFRKLVLLEQTLFGLPWTLVGALLAFATGPVFVSISSWLALLVAFTAARTAGMSFNRLIDCELDKANPRTANRALPAGEITQTQVRWIAFSSLALFILSCGVLNTLCFVLSFPLCLLLWGYSYTKRFTPLCHFVLGIIEFFAPFMGWVAITGSVDLPPILIGLAVLFWITGMDIIYACQDIQFDREWHIYSIPAELGAVRGLYIARILHALSFAFLILGGLAAHISFLYYLGLSVVLGLFIYQHTLVRPFDLHHINRAFFTTNSLIAVTQFLFTLGAILWSAS